MYQELYYTKMCQIRTHSFYIKDYLDNSRKTHNSVRAFLAITSTTSIATWAVWDKYQIVWAFIIALSQVVNATKRFLPFQKRISPLTEAYIGFKALSLIVEDSWFNISEGNLSEQKINQKITAIKKREDEIVNALVIKCSLPDKNNLLAIAEEKTEQYMKNHFNI